MSPLTTAVSTGPWSGEMRERPDGAGEGRLLAALAAGDRTAAEELVERTYRGVFSLLRRLCGDADLAADLTQETYRKAWAALPAFDGRSQFSTWLFRIAYTTFLNHLRRPRRLVPWTSGTSRPFRTPRPPPTWRWTGSPRGAGCGAASSPR